MKILQLSKHFPYPLKDGYSIAVSYIAKSLIDNGCEVELLAMNTTKHYLNLTTLPVNLNGYKKIHTVNVDNRITPWGAFKNLFSKESFILSRFVTETFSAKLAAVLKDGDFDIVQLESVQLAPYIPVIRQHSKAKIAMRSHNVEFEIWERQIETTNFLPKKWYLQSQLTPFKKFEIDQLKHYDKLVAITEKDLAYFQKLGFQGEGISIPVGIDLKTYESTPTLTKKKLTFSFIGSLDWMPNQQGVQWFLEEVWPAVIAQFPTAKFHIAGRHAPDWLLQQMHQNVVIEGEVDSAIDFIRQHPIMVVPLFSGSGIRVKILEGMALNRVIITTNLGMEGIDAEHRKEILIADTKATFLKEIKHCFLNQNELNQIGKNARNFIENHFDNQELGRQLKEFF
ncbi:MAG: glycosyltransferase involved in cell wall biosynthesis [Paraglaciecola sp.]|jgi:glycosyltransferase involved in cell wall biosynthesis